MFWFFWFFWSVAVTFKARVSCLLAADGGELSEVTVTDSVFVFKIYFCHIVHVMLELLVDGTSCQETSV